MRIAFRCRPAMHMVETLPVQQHRHVSDAQMHTKVHHPEIGIVLKFPAHSRHFHDQPYPLPGLPPFVDAHARQEDYEFVIRIYCHVFVDGFGQLQLSPDALQLISGHRR